ncbi:hypothetical protein GIB67_015284 [Kingdonia uniflora]|uniref:E3 ubiquitin-protein ligase FANCL n=1 Tax=Kingdonia uniflora TaxID=39325 RepID=A0A7J7MTE9_9MAGN|nr:hypothetical protein GIB67_015284 [Kingdonia uniflora]
MKSNLDFVEQCWRKELAPSLSSSLYQSVYSEIEEVGWEHLVKLGEDLSYVSFRVMYLIRACQLLCARDRRRQAHTVVMHLPPSYPKCAPSVSALPGLTVAFGLHLLQDVPYVCELNWSTKSRLKDAVYQFHEHLEKLQELWSTLDDIDRDLWVVHPRQPSRATSLRQINLGNGCYALLSINACDPRSLPECRFLGSDSIVDYMGKTWRRNNKRWLKDKPFLENLAIVLAIMPPKPPEAQRDDQQVECGICYAQCLPVDNELGARSGSGPDYKCDNVTCNRAFHSVCLEDWLRSITTTRQ